MKKKVSISILLTIFTLALVYVTNITGIPDSIVLFQGEKLSLGTIYGITASESKYASNGTIQTSTSVQGISENTGEVNLKLSLFGTIPLKEVAVNVVPVTKVIPCGDNIGLKLYTNGVLVVGLSEVDGLNSKSKPYEEAGIKEGDMIVSIDNKHISNTDELIQTVNEVKDRKVDISYLRNGKLIQTKIEPKQVESGYYKLGLWVRDAAAGVGTIAFYDPSTGMFAALGHGIVDVDTNELLDISQGQAVTSNIVSIKKGQKGIPGEIKGAIADGEVIGKVYKNTAFGVFGKIDNPSALNIDMQSAISVASRDEVVEGPAKIICSLENGIKKEYDIQIEKIDRNNNADNKSMIIKVTDPDLLNITGGIIQGMSGSPIIQNDKFMGAVTHVLVNDPTKGYGVFADLMIKQMMGAE